MGFTVGIFGSFDDKSSTLVSLEMAFWWAHIQRGVSRGWDVIVRNSFPIKCMTKGKFCVSEMFGHLDNMETWSWSLPFFSDFSVIKFHTIRRTFLWPSRAPCRVLFQWKMKNTAKWTCRYKQITIAWSKMHFTQPNTHIPVYNQTFIDRRVFIVHQFQFYYLKLLVPRYLRLSVSRTSLYGRRDEAGPDGFRLRDLKGKFSRLGISASYNVNYSTSLFIKTIGWEHELSDTDASQRSWARILSKPELFSRFNFTTA